MPVATADKVTIASSFELCKMVTFTTSRLAHFVNILANVDVEARELNRKMHLVACFQHIGDSYYGSVISGVICDDTRKFCVTCGLQSDQVRPVILGAAPLPPHLTLLPIYTWYS